MGRYAGKTIADVPYHIINRGNNHHPIFFCDDDYLFFLNSLELAKGKDPCRIYRFVLMTNHIHLILEPAGDGGNLAYFTKHISQRHVAYRSWFHESIPKIEWEVIREAVQRNWAYGNSPFKEEMEKALERKFELKKAGRKPKM
jgi:REP element-mobilizing transposase RayT